MAGPADHPQRLARHGSEATGAPRVLLPGGRLLLLFRPLLRGPVYRPAPREGPAVLPGPPSPYPPVAPGGRRLLVGLPAVQLPPTLRHRLRPHVLEVVPQGKEHTALIG